MLPFSSPEIPLQTFVFWLTCLVAGLSTKPVNRLCQPIDRGQGAALFKIWLAGRRQISNSPRATSCWTPGHLGKGLSPLFQPVSFWTNEPQPKFTRRASCCARPTMLQTSEIPTWDPGPCRSFLGATHRAGRPLSTSLVERSPRGLDRRAAGGRDMAARAAISLQMAGAICLALGARLGRAFFKLADRQPEKPDQPFGRWGARTASIRLGPDCPSVSSGLVACAR